VPGQEVHWRHAEEGMPSDEAATEEPASAPIETEGTPANVSCQHDTVAAATQQADLQSATAQGSAAWGGSTAAIPWSDYAAGEGDLLCRFTPLGITMGALMRNAACLTDASIASLLPFLISLCSTPLRDVGKHCSACLL